MHNTAIATHNINAMQTKLDSKIANNLLLTLEYVYNVINNTDTGTAVPGENADWFTNYMDTSRKEAIKLIPQQLIRLQCEMNDATDETLRRKYHLISLLVQSACAAVQAGRKELSLQNLDQAWTLYEETL